MWIQHHPSIIYQELCAGISKILSQLPRAYLLQSTRGLIDDGCMSDITNCFPRESLVISRRRPNYSIDKNRKTDPSTSNRDCSFRNWVRVLTTRNISMRGFDWVFMPNSWSANPICFFGRREDSDRRFSFVDMLCGWTLLRYHPLWPNDYRLDKLGYCWRYAWICWPVHQLKDKNPPPLFVGRAALEE